MFAKFEIEEGDLKGLSLSLGEGDVWTIGRDSDECQLVIEDPMVSQKHLIVRRDAKGNITAENLSATNPALLNDEILDDQPRLLQNGDALKIGNEVIRYYEDTAAHIIDEKTSLEEDDQIVEKEPFGAILNKENSETPRGETSKEFDEHFENIEQLLEGNGTEEFLKDELHSPLNEEESAIEKTELENQQVAFEPEPQEMKEPQKVAESSTASPQLEEIPQAPLSPSEEESSSRRGSDTLFADEGEDLGALAEIDFGMIETGRWLLKVIGGPNNGAEFHMESGESYILGTDPRSCDIVFHDNSVSRQHARITVTPEDTIFIEDLKSRNGILVNGEILKEKLELPQGAIVTLGTTSFAIYDREGEMQTIISPLLPSIVKVLQQQESEKETESAASETPVIEKESIPKEEFNEPKKITEPVVPVKPQSHFGPYVILSALIGLFVLAGIGTTTLFYEKPVTVQVQENADELIGEALKPFPAVRFNFNKSTGALFLLGHVTNSAEKNQLLHYVRNLKFIKNVDENNIIIDEGVLSEVNSLLSNNSAFKGITIHSPAAGQFILGGELQTRKQAEELTSYLNLNFSYVDLLKKQIVVEEDVVNQINAWLQDAQLFDVSVKMKLGENTLTGSVPPDKQEEYNQIVAKIKQIPGVRILTNLVRPQTIETGVVNITEHYPVMGKSKIGDKYTVVINGRILSEGSDLDGMTITKITANRVSLERNGDKFRIDY